MEIPKIIIIFFSENNKKVMQQSNYLLTMLYKEMETLFFPIYYVLFLF